MRTLALAAPLARVRRAVAAAITLVATLAGCGQPSDDAAPSSGLTFTPAGE